MREILFKAKRIDNGEWVYGSYVYTFCEDKNGIVVGVKVEKHWIVEESGNMVWVDKDTICQCTGLNDKNGKLIWENDVVKQFYDCNELGNSLYFFYQIRWNNEYSAFEGYEIYTKETVLFPDLEDIEVIGNIFDNPELMNE